MPEADTPFQVHCFICNVEHMKYNILQLSEMLVGSKTKTVKTLAITLIFDCDILLLEKRRIVLVQWQGES